MAKIFRLRSKVTDDGIEIIAHKRAARGRYAAQRAVRFTRAELRALAANGGLFDKLSPGKAGGQEHPR